MQDNELKYKLIMNHIRKDIDSGLIKPGHKLPSIRSLSDVYKCSKSTVIKAYDELEKEHLVYAVPNSGYFFLDSKKSSTTNSQRVLDFETAAPDLEVLPYQEFQRCLNKAVDCYKDSLFSYGDPQGLLSLRDILRTKYLPNHQIFTASRNIFITSGTQQALNILALLDFPNGKKNVLIEQPVYNGLSCALGMHGIKALGIERKYGGIDLDQLENSFKNHDVKFFFTIPRFQNPTGASYTQSQKKAILQLAKKYDVYIVEDDYLADLEINLKNDSMYAMDEENRVIYIKSFSKILLPGLRLGMVIMPDLLTNQFKAFKKITDINTNVLSQGALEIYIKSGMFDSHVKKIQPFYHKRMQHMKEQLVKLFPDLPELQVPDTGFFVMLELPQTISASTLVSRMNVQHIRITEVSPHYLDNFQKVNAIRMSICRVNEEEIGEGVLILRKEYNKVRDFHTHYRREESLISI